jgi:putative transposase
VLGKAFWAKKYFCATARQMTEELIKECLDHHFEPNSSDIFRMEPD